jgi:polar amino acid transport system permease protein
MGLDIRTSALMNPKQLPQKRFSFRLKWPVLVVVCLIMFTGCMAEPRDEIVGKWRTPNGNTTLEFFEDGTAHLEGSEVSFDLEYRFIDDAQILMQSASVEETWNYKATSETLSLTAASGQRYIKVQKAVDWRFVRRIYPDMLEGLEVTVRATIISFALALVFGFVFALGRRSENSWISLPTAAYVDFTRSTPLLVQLFFFFFVLPRYGVKLPAFQLGVAAIGVHYGTYCSEVYRAGIDAVPRGQWEAAKALNLSAQRKWFAIILPQALPPMIPAFGNYLVAMFKETALLAAIAVPELLDTARSAGTQAFRYLEPITLVGLMYFSVSFPASLLVQGLERRFGRKHSR